MSSSIEKLSKIKKAYDSPTWWYDIRGFFILKLAYQDSLISQIRFFGRNTHGHHLEAAIGTGTLTQMIYWYNVYIQRKPKWKGFGFDYSEEMLEGSKQKFKGTGFETILADVGQLPFKENEFDTINVANALHCFPDVSLALSELHRVLKIGGSIFINVILYPNILSFRGRIAQRLMAWGMRKGILYRPYYEEEVIKELIGRGFKISYQQKSGNRLNIIAEK